MSRGITRGSGLLEKFLAKQRTNIANKFIKEESRNGRILDFGCGSWPFFLINTEFKEKYGVDPNVDKSSLEENQKNIILNNLELKQGTVLPFQEDFFDVVTMLAVFEHIEPNYLEEALSEVRRVLKPGGRFILTTPHPLGDKLLRIMALIRLVSPQEIDDHKGAYTHKQIAVYLKKAGFYRDKMKFGRFELWLNNWVYLDK